MRRLPRVPGVTCPLQARRGQYRGYQVEWTYKDGPEAHHRLCPGSSGAILFDSAILRGNGSEQLGDELRRGIEPRLRKILPAVWTKGCDGSLAIILPSKEHDCRIDEVIEMIGEYLRKRDANDRIVVMRGLHAAPAL